MFTRSTAALLNAYSLPRETFDPLIITTKVGVNDMRLTSTLCLNGPLLAPQLEHSYAQLRTGGDDGWK